jgi:aryl-alcohol dehydrogenase-like predicted oxidoreductase
VQIAAVFKRAKEAGVTLLNSAEFYGADRINEKTIAELSGGSFQVALKVGAIGDLDNHSTMTMTSDPKHLRETVDEARKILGVDCIDLVVQARQDPTTRSRT